MQLKSERRGAVQILTIDRPEARNSLNSEVITGLGLGLAEADADPAVSAVVITGTGEQAFCAGMDLRGFVEGAASADEEQQRRGRQAYSSFIRSGISKPVIGAANGTAVAGGFELLTACDLIVASSEARFGLPEVKRALFPAGGGIFLSRRIPLAVAMELCLIGDYIDASRAVELGLVNRVSAPADVLATALDLADRVAANGPLAVTAIKRLVRAAANQPADEVWAIQDELQPRVFGSDDAKEGAAAFLEKRPPVWRNR
jgi:enoyl-CoA hydratase/carnithine racemase